MKKINILMLILITLLSCFMLTACFDSGSTQTDEPCEHVYRAWKTTKEVTCLENGLKERSCFWWMTPSFAARSCGKQLIFCTEAVPRKCICVLHARLLCMVVNF